ncbi:hypothetical protein EV363DRAFT_1299134 [Boletus edulis]|nr:hypothetical protein EV363DRAFT_1299134 [Boletus edulis]
MCLLTSTSAHPGRTFMLTFASTYAIEYLPADAAKLAFRISIEKPAFLETPNRHFLPVDAAPRFRRNIARMPCMAWERVYPYLAPVVPAMFQYYTRVVRRGRAMWRESTGMQSRVMGVQAQHHHLRYTRCCALFVSRTAIATHIEDSPNQCLESSRNRKVSTALHDASVSVNQGFDPYLRAHVVPLNGTRAHQTRARFTLVQDTAVA